MYSQLAHALFLNKDLAASCLARPLTQWNKFAASSTSLGGEAFTRLETVPLVEFLIRYFKTNDRTWRDLYIGERIKQVHFSTDNLEQNRARRERILKEDRESLCKLLSGQVDSASREQLDVFLSDALRLATASTQEVHVLFIGDCLLLHIASFCVTALLEVGITLRPMYEPSKSPFELRNSIQRLDDNGFDLIAYSPYSYEFSLLMSQTFHIRSLAFRSKRLQDIATSASDQAMLTLGLLSDKFACPIAVHTTAHIRPYHDKWRSYAVTVATRRTRQKVAAVVNRVLEQKTMEYNRLASRPLITIDERPLLGRHSERVLGKKLYDAIYYHPTALSLELSRRYPTLLASVKFLLHRKVLVTDLDNTLWNGLIGEGPVEHVKARQKVLKALRRKGVLLAIASKNDPAHVRWEGAHLTSDDFVAVQINWESKPGNLRRIAAQLNLGLNDFVFVDDREDELEMVRLAQPEVYTMSANSASTWQMLEWWAAALPEQGVLDRTQLYREREARQTHLASEVASDNNALLASLDLKLDIRAAGSRDATRVTELVNRTHQFNTNPQFVSQQQIAAWATSPDHLILVGEAADKFGAMGLISVMIADLTRDEIEIRQWVLSCRVFGFGIETAMLNHLKELARSNGRESIIGHLVATERNGPCQQTYLKNGFTWKGSAWVFEGEAALPNPPWLLVKKVA